MAFFLILPLLKFSTLASALGLGKETNYVLYNSGYVVAGKGNRDQLFWDISSWLLSWKAYLLTSIHSFIH